MIVAIIFAKKGRLFMNDFVTLLLREIMEVCYSSIINKRIKDSFSFIFKYDKSTVNDFVCIYSHAN